MTTREAEIHFTITAPVTTFLLRHAAELPKPGGRHDPVLVCWREFWDELTSLVAAQRARTPASRLHDKLVPEAMRTCLARWDLAGLGPEFHEMYKPVVRNFRDAQIRMSRTPQPSAV